MAPDREFRLPRIARPIRIWSSTALLFTPLAVFGSPAHGADEWTTMNKDYSAQRYVDLDEITKENAGSLREVCEIELNQPVVFSSGLLMVGGTLYVLTNRQTVAFDAATCALRWRHVLDFKGPPVGAGGRGLGYLDGKVFRGAPDGRVMAFDANTGKVLWDVQAANPERQEMFPSAPIAWQGKVFIGLAYSDSGLKGRLMALDADTGKELWRFNTTLGYSAGGGFWSSYSLDPATGEVFAGVANPHPDFNREIAPDDPSHTVYTNSLISVDAATGRLNWHYQAVPRDEHDWDLASTPTLYRTSAGKDMVAIAGKDGHVYGIDRATHLQVFKTAGTSLENNDVALSNKWMHVCPGLQGGAMFNGAAYSPLTGALFVGMADHCAWYIKDKSFGEQGGAPIKDWSTAAKLEAPKGWITAINSETGAALWRYHTDSQALSGLVPTKSGLLFAGDAHGNLLVLDATNGSLLKRIDAGGALNNGLISYAVEGAQYVAAAVGGATENPSTVAGPLRVVVYGLHGGDKPTVVALDRLAPAASGTLTAQHMVYVQACAQCHGPVGAGGSAPPLARQSQLADPELLKQFLATVLPPMPRLYPGVLNDDDVRMLTEYLKTDVFRCGSDELQVCGRPGQPTTGGTKEWRDIYSVLTSPRCLNCHPVESKLPPLGGIYAQDYPRQGDDRHPHVYNVIRGDPIPFQTAENTGIVSLGIGSPIERCSSCHATKNDPATGIPGAIDPAKPDEAFWFLAPASMAWEKTPGVALSGPELCARLKDKTRNGNRELKDTLHHLATEFLVLWAWNPGTRLNGEPRTTPPLSHDAFVKAFADWMDKGAPCPTD